MRIAVCDDEKAAAEMLADKLNMLSDGHQIREFISIQRFQEAIDDGERFDVILMDIDWKQESDGIDFAEELERTSPSAQIIYVTGYNERYSQQIFLKSSNLCGYLVKPVDIKLLEKLLQKAEKAIERLEQEKLMIQQKGIVYAIPFRNICYLESMRHQIIIHTTGEQIVCYDQIDHLMQRLSPAFLQCHKSFVVNMNYIRRIDKNRILLQTREEIPISKARYAETRTAYFRYMGELL
ncbi:MAG: LytTR family DNA-binding domain-containing protein [Lachnospiraceae bacterium]|nr:LytTR family DNA-binding domain-containing protein [Lachnospiraceae bacterium]